MFWVLTHFFQTSYSPAHYVYIYVFNIFNKNKFFWIISMMIKIRLSNDKSAKTWDFIAEFVLLFTIFKDIYFSYFQCICGGEIKFVIFILRKAWRHLNIFFLLPLTFTKDAVIRRTYVGLGGWIKNSWSATTKFVASDSIWKELPKMQFRWRNNGPYHIKKTIFQFHRINGFMNKT